MILPLNEKQLKSLPQEIDKTSKPFRILADGQSVNICTGDTIPKGTNILYHYVYWNRTKEFINLVIKYLRENNPNVSFRITRH